MLHPSYLGGIFCPMEDKPQTLKDHLSVFFNLLKDNLSLIILLPTLVGGLWQIIALSSISTSYIRFFSATQLISDGLLILFVFTTILLSIVVSEIIILKIFNSKKLTPLLKSSFVFSLQIVMIISSYFINRNNDVFTLTTIAFFVWSFAFLINLLPYTLNIITKKYQNSYIHKFRLENFKLSIIINSVITLLIVFLLFNKHFLAQPSLLNLGNVWCKIKYKHSHNNDLEHYNIVYFNDKYIFASIKEKDYGNFIEVYRFKELFNEEECSKYKILNEMRKGNEIKDSLAKQNIKSILIDMWDAIEKGDIDRYASYVHDDFTQFGEYDSVLRSGKAAEIKGISEWIKSSTPIQTKMHDPKVTVNSNTAFITYYWSDSGSTNGKPFATRGKSTRIFVKENGKWLCIHGHYTLLP